MNRREFIKTLSLPALASLPLGISSGSTHAAVEPVTAFVAAIGIIKSIAEANRGDGGLGASLTAINGKLDIAIAQLATIQKSIEYMIGQIAELKEDIIKALGEQYAHQLHNAVSSAIEGFQDVVHAAEKNGVKLTPDNANRGAYPQRLQLAYNTFDIERRKLRRLPEGRAPISSSICSLCLAVDTAAFAYGIIDDADLSISIGRHLEWLRAMLDPNMQYSIAASLISFENSEKLIIDETAGSSKREFNPASDIAYELYRSSPVELCVLVQMDTEYYNQHMHGQYLRAGVATSVFVATFARDIQINSGAEFLTNITIPELSNAFIKPDGTSWRPTPLKPTKAETIDRANCRREALEMWQIPVDRLVRAQADKQHPNTFWSGKTEGWSFKHMQSASRIWRGWLAAKTVQDVQRIFDRINVERLKQTYAKECMALVTAHLDVADHLGKRLLDANNAQDLAK